MKIWTLVLAACAAASAVPSLPTNSRFCIDECKCKLSKLITSRLQIIDCDRPLTINASTFHYISKAMVNVISFENVNIYQIQESAFSGFKNLDDILFINSRIGAIDAKVFNNTKRVKFHGCRFEDSPDLSSEVLEELHFGECGLEQIPRLNNLLKLTFLNLTGNLIKNVEVETFAELFELEELYLSNNEIFRLPATIFINNQELNSLYLDNNPIKHFRLNTSENLETLSLKNCQLETFDEESARKLSTLNELILSHNHIKTISHKSLDHMKELSVINLSYNKLTVLDDDVFSGNQNLIKIVLDGNNFETLPRFFLRNGKGFTTYTFSCNHCGLKTLDGSVFQNMAGMINLELSHNKFKNVDNIFDPIASLKILDISYNKIAYLGPATFKNNRNIETLNIAGNPLMVLNPEVFADNGVLREIDARNASLTKLWANANNVVKSLRKILLGGNELATISEEEAEIMPNLEAIDLNNNPLIFDEKLCSLIHEAELRGVSPIEYTKNLYTGMERTFGEDIDGFSTMEWKEFHKNACPQITSVKYIPIQPELLDDITTDKTNELADEEYDDDDEDDDDDYDLYEEETVAEDQPLAKDMHEETLARASYILSITSVFVLSALVVLTVAVAATLCILRRNNRFDMHKANLPRLKIPLWTTGHGEKKHSGSVYRPLSEDLSGPKTPTFSRYEFPATPTVHST
ncbi:unnamed protein product [Phaedon cochleariae]|uniref:Uncharacterized protein n=1 Tax=Phaedon cochleariae TaxID=80249 RepID=A0A9P0DGY9_PHACE|nr:unnamed protein product [Phaedon cochleariae]